MGDLRAYQPALRWMVGRSQVPVQCDPTELPGGGRLGWFWRDCKILRRCGRPPYDRLLTNPVLRADYRITAAARETVFFFRFRKIAGKF